jgi:hypothetical protein
VERSGLGRRLVGRGLVQVEQRHTGAARGETADDRQADARRAAGHNCHPAQLFSSSCVAALMALPGLWYH